MGDLSSHWRSAILAALWWWSWWNTLLSIHPVNPVLFSGAREMLSRPDPLRNRVKREITPWRIVFWSLTHTNLSHNTIKNLHTQNLKLFSDWLYTAIHPLATKKFHHNLSLCSCSRKLGRQGAGLLDQQRQIVKLRANMCVLTLPEDSNAHTTPPLWEGLVGKGIWSTSIFRRVRFSQWGMGWERAWSLFKEWELQGWG